MVAIDVEELKCNMCGKEMTEEEFHAVQDDADKFTDEVEDIWIATVLIFMATKEVIYRHEKAFVACAECVQKHTTGCKQL